MSTVVRQRGRAVSALLREIGGKSDGPALGSGWVHELADRREDGGDGLIVGSELLLETRLELIEATGERPVRGEEFAHAHEGPHDLDVDGDGALAAKHRGEHGHALLGEDVGQVLAVLAAAGL